MKKAMVFAAAFAAGSAMAQVGTLSGGVVGAAGGSSATSNMGPGGRFGAGPQIPTPEARASAQPPAAARPPRASGSVGTASPASASAATASGATPIVSGTSWGSAQTGAPAGAAQAEERRDLLEDKGDRQIDKP